MKKFTKNKKEINSKANDCTVRIISGKHKGRKIKFLDFEGLRPTPDRVKETLFNWLAPAISNASCLDLFAGSGSLGFEAASRGASKVIMVEKENTILDMLKKNILALRIDNIEVVGSDVMIYLAYLKGRKFDIIFLDPPFHKNLLQECLDAIHECQLLKPSSLIYIESEAEHEDLQLPEGFSFYARKKAGNVSYCLAFKENN